VALCAIAAAAWYLHAATLGTTVQAVEIGRIPARIYRPTVPALGPVVVIAHGFAGSEQLMQSFALTFARNGYVAVTFDFPGHGRNPQPLSGSLTDEHGATATLLAALTEVCRYARGLGDGRLAVLGHSMASDIVVRYAEAAPDVTATIAVSMFSPVVTATAPRDLLVIVGAWEPTLKLEALRAVGLSIAPQSPHPEQTYGSFADGTARRAAFSPHVEHLSVLFSARSMRESLGWLDQAFGIVRHAPPEFDARGPWIMLLLGAIVALARPLARGLPVVAIPPRGAGLPWRRLLPAVLVPMIATPLLLRVLPTHFLPVVVGDYLAMHFAMYGVLTAACLMLARPQASGAGISRRAMIQATLAVVVFGFVAIVWPLNALFTSFLPGAARGALILVMLPGTLAFFLSDEWLTRGVCAPRGAYPASKLAFVLSLAAAVALDFQRLFFLVIIVPVITVFFVVYGLFSRWIYRATGYPFVAAIGNAVAFAWAIGVTFPLLAG
jgi:pimeloyl-ACP methyl ester carboxylesterase